MNSSDTFEKDFLIEILQIKAITILLDGVHSLGVYWKSGFIHRKTVFAFKEEESKQFILFLRRFATFIPKVSKYLDEQGLSDLIDDFIYEYEKHCQYFISRGQKGRTICDFCIHLSKMEGQLLDIIAGIVTRIISYFSNSLKVSGEGFTFGLSILRFNHVTNPMSKHLFEHKGVWVYPYPIMKMKKECLSYGIGYDSGDIASSNGPFIAGFPKEIERHKVIESYDKMFTFNIHIDEFHQLTSKKFRVNEIFRNQKSSQKYIEKRQGHPDRWAVLPFLAQLKRENLMDQTMKVLSGYYSNSLLPEYSFVASGISKLMYINNPCSGLTNRNRSGHHYSGSGATIQNSSA